MCETGIELRFRLSLHFGLLIISVDIKLCVYTFTNYGFCRLTSLLRSTVQYIKNLTTFRWNYLP